MSEQQVEVLPEEEETQRSYDFDDCFMIAGTDESTKKCLVQENKLKQIKEDDSEWQIKYQSKKLLKS